MKKRLVQGVTLGGALAAVGISILCSPLMHSGPTKHQTTKEQELPGRRYLEEQDAKDFAVALSEIQGQETEGQAAISEGAGAEDGGKGADETAEATEIYAVSQQGEQTEDAEQSWAKRFENSVIMGDSIAVGFTEFEFLNETSVVARTGISMRATAEEVQSAAGLAPQNIFLYYGFNDVGHVGENYERFRSEYASLLENILDAMPDAAVYVNSLFQPLPDNGTMNGYYNDISPYNQVIEEVCEQYGVTYLDNTQLPQEEDFAADGYHLKSSFYPKWLQAMADAAGL